MEAVWCVGHRDGYCALAVNRKPADDALNVKTACGHYVVLPWRFNKTVPECGECIAALRARNGGK